MYIKRRIFYIFEYIRCISTYLTVMASAPLILVDDTATLVTLNFARGYALRTLQPARTKHSRVG
jgi:hypothetical protein